MKKRFATILVLLTLALRAFAQEAAAPQEARTGFTGGGFPILGYDPDMGMRSTTSAAKAGIPTRGRPSIRRPPGT